ncbi:enoyl-CoA hydratase/isomerase family protein [Streptomyces sp. MAR4 CNX-425]|uniref:enoyl-CoA hydratase/isomerase family protein n=1 Tax=Streptomyces sp. MAR4 CNX-425 TaxID=3406343 RepID=UPI003B510578
MSEGELRCGTDGGVATVVISNPAKRNAMTPGMWRALPGLLAGLAADRAVRAVVLTGADGTFCAGADIGSLRTGGADTQGLAEAAEAALAAFPKPTLAAVRGHCVGGGCQLAAACDLRFAAEDAVFGVTPAKLGLVYPAGATRRLVRLVGPAMAKYLLFSAELVGAARALRTGLVDEVLPGAELAARVAEFTAVLAARSQLTQAAAKEFADTAGGHGEPYGDGDPAGGADAARVAHWSRQAHAAGDPAEGVAAFLERREPRFTWTV